MAENDPFDYFRYTYNHLFSILKNPSNRVHATERINECLSLNRDLRATTLHYAVCDEDCSIEDIEILLNNRANVCAKDKHDQTPLHYLAKKYNKHAIQIAGLLLDHGAKLDLEDRFSRTALHYAARTPTYTDFVRFLLDKGANLHAKCTFGYTPLHDVSMFYSYDIAKVLLERGANVHDRIITQQQPLHLAAEFIGNPNMVKLLVNYGAQVNVVDNFMESPLYITIRKHNTIEVSKMLLGYGALLSCGKSPLGFVINEYSGHSHEYKLVIMRLLVKYALLENAVLHVEDINTNSSLPEALIGYRAECLREISAMKEVSIDNTPLVQFIFQLGQELLHKRKDDINHILKKLLPIICTNDFPLYNEVMIAVIQREHLEYNVDNLLVYVAPDQLDLFSGCQKVVKVILPVVVKHNLISYLSDTDLLNFVLAYYN